ncbi:MAG: hypothetical protein GF317_21235, partial [Candidatus Lokiarchaeota archaeon]|nr:hypothetical protein [Candidatus Lokiarchaeota archaeon]
MEINWTPEVLANGIAATIVFLAVIIVFALSERKKLKSLLYFRLVFFFVGLYSIFEALSDLFLFKPIAIIGVMLLFPTAVFAIIAINYVVKDTYFSYTLLFLIAIGPVLLLLTVDLNAFVLYTGDPYTYISSTQWPLFTELFFTTFFGFSIFYWALKTYLNAPFLIKKDALIFLIGVFLAGVIAIILNIFTIFSRIFVIIALAFADIGTLIILYMVEREPKLFYILPFVVHRILVKDNNGFPLYDHDWSKSDIDEVLFSGFINAVQHMSNEIMDIGGLLDINLERGILILHHSKYITVGLVATKSSKLLRDSLM